MDRLVSAHPAPRKDLAASGEVAFPFADFKAITDEVVWKRDEGIRFHAAALCFAFLAFLLLPYTIDASGKISASKSRCHLGE